MFRPRADVQHQIDLLKQGIFQQINREKYSVVTIHFRGGHVDWGRRVSSLEYYMNALKIKSTKLEKDGKPVAIV